MFNLSFYKAIFVLEIMIAEFMFMLGLEKRKGFWWRMLASALVCVGVALVLPSIKGPVLFSLEYFVLFLLTVAFMKLCYKETWTTLLFCSLAAYTLQHFSYEFVNFFLTLAVWGRSPLLDIYNTNVIEFLAFNKEAIFWILIYLSCYVISYGGAYFGFCKRLKKEKIVLKNSWFLLLFGIGLFVNIIFNSIIVTSVSVQDAVISLIVCAYNVFCCFLLLLIQFSLLKTKKLDDELEFVQTLLDKEKEQYALLYENINLVNIKCHDIKHHIRKIGDSNSLSADTIAELESAVLVYDTLAKTGNKVLDTLLTEKTLYCRQNDIMLSFMADGEILSFLKESEVYSLFGNIIDNAVEATRDVDEKDKRIITLRVIKHGSFVAINSANYFSGGIELGVDGLPKSRGDAREHGFGMKSIKYIVDAHGGNLSLSTNDGVFKINVLLPIKQ